MESFFNRQPTLPRLLLGLGLALFLFVWGMQYKLSLYDPPESISHSIPAAKLLSNSEKAGDVVKGTVEKGKASFLDQVTILVIVSVFFAITIENAFCLEIWRKSRSRFQQALAIRLSLYSRAYFFRPPPSLL